MMIRRLKLEQERGTTLSEVLVVLTLVAIVATPLMIVLQSGTRTERQQSEQLDAEQQLALVADRFESDVRSGRPAADRAGGRPSDHLAVAWTEADGSETLVVWSIDNGALRRTATIPASGAVVSDVVLIDDVVSVDPVFRYWEASGLEIAPSAVDRIVGCAARVTLELRTESGPVESERTIDVAHRIRQDQPC